MIDKAKTLDECFMARGNVSNTGLMMARLCYDLLMEKGRDALAAVERHEVTYYRGSLVGEAGYRKQCKKYFHVECR